MMTHMYMHINTRTDSQAGSNSNIKKWRFG